MRLQAATPNQSERAQRIEPFVISPLDPAFLVAPCAKTSREQARRRQGPGASGKGPTE